MSATISTVAASGEEQLNFSVNLLQTILWNRNVDVNLQTLFENKQAWYDENQTAFWTDWLTNVFNLRTANDFGCNVWAIILGLPLSIISPAVPNTSPPFGFGSETSTPNTNGNFFNYNFAASSGDEISFTLEEKRLILLLRYRKLVTRPSIPNINKILNDLLVPVYGPMYMLDGLDMTQTLSCAFAIPSDLNIILGLDLLPRGEGVELKLVSNVSGVFGFGSETAMPNTNLNFGSTFSANTSIGGS
jgi:hypothetical protein